MKMFKSLFFVATLLTSGVVFSGPKEDCASMIAKFLFKTEDQEYYHNIFNAKLNETKFLETFKNNVYTVESLESAHAYLAKEDEDENEYLLLFKKSILLKYLLDAHPSSVSIWKDDLEASALGLIDEIKKNTFVSQEINEQDFMVKTEPVGEFQCIEVPSATNLPLTQIKEDVSRLDGNQLKNLSQSFDGKNRSPEKVKKNLNKVFSFVEEKPFLKSLLNNILPSDTVSRFVSSAEENNSQPSNSVFSGKGVSIGGEKESSVQDETKKEEDLGQPTKRTKFSKKEEE